MKYIRHIKKFYVFVVKIRKLSIPKGKANRIFARSNVFARFAWRDVRVKENLVRVVLGPPYNANNSRYIYRPSVVAGVAFPKYIFASRTNS